MSYDESQDAHKQSNYSEWKKTAHIITDVEINLESTGITHDDVVLMADCMVNDMAFALIGRSGFVVIVPEHNSIKQEGNLMKYPTRKQLVNAIKLLLFNYNKVFIPDKSGPILELPYKKTMATKKQVAPKTKKKAVKKVENLDAKTISDHVSKLPYKQRDHLINHLSESNRKDNEAFSQGQEPDGAHYGTYQPE